MIHARKEQMRLKRQPISHRGWPGIYLSFVMQWEALEIFNILNCSSRKMTNYTFN